MNKKTLTIIATVVIFILLGIGAYFYFKKSTTTTPVDSLFPGGSGPAVIIPGEGDEGEVDVPFTPGVGSALPRLYELHKTPVAGITFFETGKAPNRIFAVRYIERGLGHIYETALSSYTKSRIVNETRSRISEALWGKNGQSLVVRFLDQEGAGIIKTRILNLATPPTTPAQESSDRGVSSFIETEEIFLPDYIPFMATAEDGADKIFYFERGFTSTVGMTTSFKNATLASVFSSSFTEWLPQFPNQKLVTLTTRPSHDIPGHLFFLDPTTKTISKILSNINGLTTLTRRDGKFVLYAESKKDGSDLSVYNTTKKENYYLSLHTLPEKCVWATKKPTLIYCAVPKTMPQSLYPDRWYQGVVSFSDEIWEIDTETTEAKRILIPEALGAPTLDITNLTISSGDEYLIFMNKNTGTPWVYRITEEAPFTTTTPVTTTPTVATPTSEPIPTFEEGVIPTGMKQIR